MQVLDVLRRHPGITHPDDFLSPQGPFPALMYDMIKTEAMNVIENNDADLVAESRGGSRDAFRQIVERYQTLICSLAYSATGNVSQSEDVAQETFLSAWKDLRSLREPEKLRSWLCGIVRNRIHQSVQRDGREPAHDAMPLEDAHDPPACEALPSEQAISREEEAILWRSLERIPGIYREPLILFYRKHQSIEYVADALELSEDAVKQRLSRGRKLLQEEVQAFVENTLCQTAPGQRFSGAVLAALPLAAGSAATAGVGTGAKGAAAAKSGFLATWLAPLAPFLGIAAGVGAQCLIIRAATPDRRLQTKMMVQAVFFWLAAIGLAWGGEIAIRTLGQDFQWGSRIRFTALAGFWWFYCCCMVTAMSVMAKRNLAFGARGPQAGETPPPAVAPMNSIALAAAAVGLHLAIFSGLIRVAWNAGDLMAAWTLAGIVAVLSVLAFLRLLGKTGGDAGRISRSHLGFCCAVLLVALNLRIDVWVASAYGTTVAEAHQLQPIWIVPVLSLAFFIWVVVMSILTKSKSGAQ
jgi:RNA polymerase sigma factor (sigma-70 family)